MMRFGVLGPLIVSDNDRPCAPSAPKQRQLLAFLLVHSNCVVTFTDCIEELWESEPPSSTVPTLRTYVMYLRRTLRATGGPDRLLTRGQGYLFHVEPGELDLEVFESRVRAARRAAGQDDVLASSLLAEALSLWRGRAFTGIPTVGPVLRGLAAELDERRRSAIQERIELDLRLGRHHELLPELATLVAAHPFHEDFSAQLMTALYRSGRTACALRVYQRLRGSLADEYGLDPAPRIQRLQRSILAMSPELDVTARATSRLALDLVAERVPEPS